MYGNLSVVSGNVVCEPLQEEWASIVNTSICHDYAIGLYILFVTVILMIFFLFGLLVVLSLLYQYFDDLNVVKGSDLEIPFRDSEGNPLAIPHTITGAQLTASAGNSPFGNDDRALMYHDAEGSSSKAGMRV
jgi:hypothetical protein